MADPYLDVIAAFPNVTEISDLPVSDLCSYCNVQKLSLMQANAYSSVYDSNWQTMYQYMARACNITVADFNATSSVFNVSVPVTPANCVSGNLYTTQQGDTCDSIALAKGASAATMFYTNSNVHNCSAIAAGTVLCLPLTCADLYTVKSNDTCTSIAIEWGIRTQDLLSYNSQLNWNCTNLQSTNPYWGSTLCVSTPGGTYTGQALNTSTSSGPSVVNSPTGATVAPGTTLDCGEWFVDDPSLNLTCVQICLAYGIAIDLFTAANPSLNKTTCDTDLVLGDAYCIEPITGWNYVNTSTSTNSTSSSTGSTTTPTSTGVSPTTTTAAATSLIPTTSTGNGISTPTPYQTGMATNCNKFHLVVSGDQCGTIASNAGISLTDFYAWNPAVGSTCSTLDLNDYVCIGTLNCTSASVLPAPAQYASVCGLPGISHDSPTSLSIVSYTSGPYVVSAAACGAQCLATATCTNLYFIEGESCKLHQGNSTFGENTVDGYTWFEASCFSSGEACGSPGLSHDTASKQIVEYTAGSQVSSAEACGAACLSTSTCTNVYFMQGTSCKLHSGEFSYEESTVAGYYFWYPLNCFVCSASS